VTYSDRYDALFRREAAVPEGVEPWPLDWIALKAQAIAESLLAPDAVSPVGALGIMQFMPSTWLWWWRHVCQWIASEPVPNPFDPARSIEAGAGYMRWLLRALGGDLVAARAAYNWGIGRVRKHLEIHHGTIDRAELPAETRDYLARIERIEAELRAAPP
jgi:soluble lytic murein transglycosylase-like protein